MSFRIKDVVLTRDPQGYPLAWVHWEERATVNGLTHVEESQILYPLPHPKDNIPKRDNP